MSMYGLQNLRAWLSRKPLRVYIIFFLLAVLPILLFFYSAGLVLEEKAKGRAMQEGTQAATLGGVLIKDHFEQSTRFLASFACRPLLREAVVGRDVKKMTGHLQSAQEIGSGFQFFSVYDPSGTQLAVYPPELRSGHNYAYRDWYKGVSRHWRPYVSEVYQTGTIGNPLVVAVAVPIRNDQREVIGILMAPHRLDTIGSWVEQIKREGGWTISVIDKNGRLLAYPGINVFQPPRDLTGYEPVRRMMAGHKGNGSYSRNGEEWFVAYDTVPGSPWGIMAELPSGVVLGGVRAVQRQIGLLGLVFVGLSLVCAALLMSSYREVLSARNEVQGLNDRLEDKVRERTSALTEEIEQRQRAEQALRNDRHFVEAVLNSLGEGIVACNSEGVPTLFNRAARDFHGLPEDRLSPEQWAEHYDLYQPDGKTVMKREEMPLFRVLRGDLICNHELMIIPKRGRPRTLLATGQPIVDEDGGRLGAVVAMHDITEQKSLEEQLRQSQKLEAIGTLAGGVAHDFNNILTAILGYAEILSGQLEPNSCMHEGLEEIRKGGERAASLTRQLLAFSRKQLFKPKVLDLNGIVADTDRMLRRLIGEDIDLVTLTDLSHGRVEADPGQIEQVIMNLVVNARDAMPQGGKLTIETKKVMLDESYAREHLNVTPGEYVMLAVSDTGVGMDAETRSHIFEPFFTTKGLGKGTGLGLSTVYGIVKQNRGSIWVYSEVGKGTTFKIYFPIVEGEVTLIAQESAGSIKGGHETILLVEDDETVRKLARTALEERGYTIIEAGSGDEALRIAGARAEGIDLMLTDGVMPGVGVHELITRMRAQRPRMKFVLMSGYTDEAIARHGMLEAGATFVQKPFTPDTLSLRVREVLDRE